MCCYHNRSKITLFFLAQVILVNFQYRYKNYDKYVTTWEFPLVNYSEMTLHPYVVLNQNPDQVKLIAKVCTIVCGLICIFAIPVQRVYCCNKENLERATSSSCNQ